MIGQDRIHSRLFLDSISEFPHSLLLIGDVGCGKHTLVNELSSYYNLSLVDISKNISQETIEEIMLKPVPTMYLIDIDKLQLRTDREQNVILKFLEEPSQYAFIVLITSNKSYVLNTVVNRCVVYEFDKYTREQLLPFIKNQEESERILSICTTPGQILNLSNNLSELDKLCNTIIEKIKTANFSNTLSIVRKINLSDEYDKFNIDLFFNMLLLNTLKHFKDTKEDVYFKLYNFISEYKKRLKDSLLNKELFLENFLTNLWEFMRNVK